MFVIDGMKYLGGGIFIGKVLLKVKMDFFDNSVWVGVFNVVILFIDGKLRDDVGLFL